MTGLAATGVTQTTATISWTTSEAADGFLEYGPTTSYGQQVRQAAFTTSHQVQLSGLTPQTLYRVRVMSKDPSGNPSPAGTLTLTTLTAGDTTPPSINGVQVGGVTTTGAVISWITNESADGLVEYSTSTSYGQQIRQATLGTSHSVTLTNLTANTRYYFRITSEDSAGNIGQVTDYNFQTAGNPVSSLTVQVSDVSAKAGQGVRLPISLTVPSGQSLYGVVATLQFDSSMMQIQSLALESPVASAGKQLDTFQIAPGQLRLAVFGVESTKAIPAGPLAFAQVQIASSAAAGTRNIGLASVTAVDVAGNEIPIQAIGGRLTVQPVDVSLPRISEIVVSAITSTSASITWKTDVTTHTIIQFGATTSYGRSQSGELAASLVHQASLTQLPAAMTIHFRITATDTNGNRAETADQTFQTLPLLLDTVPPTVTLSSPAQGAIFKLGQSVLVVGTARDDRPGAVKVTVDGILATPLVDAEGAFSSSLTGLPAGTHAVTVRAMDQAGNTSELKRDIIIERSSTEDTTPPTITGPQAGGITSNSAVIRWTTSEPADGLLEYGTSLTYGQQVRRDNLTITHQVTLPGLATGTRYYLRVTSKDAAGNAAQAGPITFVTSGSSDPTPPTIVGPQAGGIRSHSAVISWVTSEAADELLEYGITPAYGQQVRRDNLTLTHQVALAGLAANTRYYVRVTSKDATGNTAQAGPMTFMTLPGVTLGDVNRDGRLTGDDVTALVDQWLGRAAVTLDVSDMNQDGQVTIGDVQQLAFVISTPPPSADPSTLTITSPAPDAIITGTIIPVTYQAGGDLAATGATHAHFTLDANPPVEEPTLDGRIDFSSVPPGLHTITGYLAMAEHTKVAGTDVTVTIQIQPATPPPPGASDITIETSRVLQTISGVGGSFAKGRELGVAQDAIGDSNLDTLRPTCVRIGIPVRGWEPTNDNEDPNAFTWNSFHDDGEVHNLFLLLKEFKRRNIPVVAAIWNVPDWMVQNPTESKNRIIPANQYDELTESIAAFLIRARDTYGVTIDAITINEPDIGFKLKFDSAPMARLITVAGPRFSALGLSVKWVLGDTSGAGTFPGLVEPLLSNASVAPYLAPSVCFHSWSGSDSEFRAVASLAKKYGKEVWITELGYDPFLFTDKTIFSKWEYAWNLANNYYRVLKHSQASRLFYWEYQNDYPLLNPMTLRPYPGYFVVKQLADHLPVGSQMVQATSKSTDILVLAAKHASRDVFMTQMINTRSSPITVTITGLPQTTLTLERTSQTEQMVTIGSYPIVNGTLTLTLPANSISTLSGALAATSTSGISSTTSAP